MTRAKKPQSAAQNKKTKPAGKTAAKNSGSVAKRGTQGAKKAAQTAPSKASAKAIKPEVAIEKDKDTVIVTLKFHGDKNGGHNHVIIEDIDDYHVSVGLSTKKKKGKNNPNYKLEQSPLADGKESYMRRQGTVAPKKEYKAPRNGEMASKDFEKAKEYGEKAKKKHLEKKATKK